MSWLAGLKFDRILAVKDRECSQCEDTIPEGAVYGRLMGEPWCADCIDYEIAKPHDERGRVIEP
jgi:hypothetical protein